MNIFKHQHPSNLISRLFMLEYFRELTPPTVYAKANKHQKEKFFYKFSDDEGIEQLDFNWEFLLFHATLHELESILKIYLEEIQKIEEDRKVIYEEAIQAKHEEESAMPVDVNIMDLAQTEINKTKLNGIIL